MSSGRSREQRTTEQQRGFGKLLLHPSFRATVNAINGLDIRLPPKPVPGQLDFDSYTYPSMKAKLLPSIEEFGKCELDSRKGEAMARDGLPICAYDESLNKFVCLEGTAYLTSHALVVCAKEDYLPSCYLTIYFYTRSKTLTAKSRFVRYSDNPEETSKKDYATDRKDFVVSNASANSVLFVDGPLIGEQLSSYTVKMNEELLSKNVIPIFFVKNSASNLVTEGIGKLRGKYNSDMHWAYKALNPGERTSFFPYRDARNHRNAKYFCYMKAYNISPQRIEFHADTLDRYGKERMREVMDLCYYLLLVQGDLSNPQIRPVAIAEKYARETIGLIDLSRLMKEAGLMATINQERFGWG